MMTTLITIVIISVCRCSRLLLTARLTDTNKLDPSSTDPHQPNNRFHPHHLHHPSSHSLIHQYTQLLDLLKQHHSSTTLTVEENNLNSAGNSTAGAGGGGVLSSEQIHRQQQITGLLLILNETAVVLLLESTSPI